VNATLRAALEATYDAAKASPEKQASSRLTLAGRSLKILVEAALEERELVIRVIDRGAA